MITAVCLVSLITACGAKKPEQISGVITFITGNTSLNGKSATVGAEVNAGDRIETQENSCAVIQFYESSLITLHEKTSVNIETLIARSNTNGGKNEISIVQNKGTTFSKIIKNEANYSTRTSTTIAAVRGTAYSFTVDSKSDDAAIRLLHGKVDVLPKSGKDSVQSVSLNDGEKIVSSSGKSTRNKQNGKTDLSETESKTLSLLDTINILPASKVQEKKYTPDEVVPKNVLPFLLETDQTGKAKFRYKHSKEQLFNTHVVYDINKKVPVKSGSVHNNTAISRKNAIADKPAFQKLADSKSAPASITNNDLAKRYGKLSTVFTNDGKEYVGAFRQSGNTIELITTEGTVKIQTSAVKKVAPYNL